MNSIAYAAYIVAGLVGVFAPITLRRIAFAFVISIVADGLRIHDFTITNALLVAFVVRAALNCKPDNPVFRSNVALAVVLFIPVAIVAWAVSHSPERARTLVSLISLLCGTLAIISSIQTPRDLDVMIKSVIWMSGIATTTVLGEVGLYQAFGVELWGGANQIGLVSLGRDVLHASGIFQSNAMAAVHIIPGLAVALTLYDGAQSPRERKKLVHYCLFCAAGVVATVARAAFVCLIALTVVYLIRGVVRKQMWKLIVLALIAVGTPPFLRFIAGFNMDSYYARYAIIWGALDVIEAHPIVGGGLGTQVISSPRSDIWGLEAQASGVAYDQSERETHNTILQIGVEMGFIGLSAWGFLNVTTLSGLWRFIRKCPRQSWFSNQSKAIIWGLIITQLFLCFDSFLYAKSIWILLGVAGGLIALAEKNSWSWLENAPRNIPRPIRRRRMVAE